MTIPKPIVSVPAAQSGRVITSTCALILVLSGCETESTWTANSNQGDNQYFGEPLSEMVLEYELALDTANRFVTLFGNADGEEAWELLSVKLRSGVTPEQIASLSRKVVSDYGAFLEFKTDQWAFSRQTSHPDRLAVIKIVQHEDSTAYYVVYFRDPGQYQEVIGFTVIGAADDIKVSEIAKQAFEELD